MSAKPETTFIHSIHKHLPSALYRMKNNNPYTGGVPDVWYSGSLGDLRVEYKFLPRVPQRGSVRPAELLSPLQTEWLRGRHKEGRAVAVIIGCPTGGAILLDPDEWGADLSASEYTQRMLDRKSIASWLERTTMR